MIYVVCSAYDKKARTFLTPFYVTHQDVAVRAFKDAVNNVESSVGRNPEDFALWNLGTFDDDKGSFTLHATPQHIVEAMAFKPGYAPLRNLAVDSNLGEE